MKKISKEIEKQIVDMYVSCDYTTQSIAEKYNINRKTVIRYCRQHNVIRTNSQSNKLMARHKNYSHNAFKVVRKTIPLKTRFLLLSQYTKCALCGSSKDDYPLQIDHIDNDIRNANINNLQVLCKLCNIGKGLLKRDTQ